MTISTIARHEAGEPQYLPCFLSRVRTGFPSPADDYMDKRLSLDEYLIKHPAATIYCWTEGESMEGVGIFDGDMLIVDRAEKPRHGDIVLASLDGELTCKILDTHHRCLRAAHKNYSPIAIREGSAFDIEGVVINVIRFFRVRPG